MSDFVVTNACIPGYSGFQQLQIQQGTITEIAPMSLATPLENLPVVNVKGDWISLGGVDLQINGGLGLAFPDLELEDLPRLHEIGQFLWQQGVDAYMPTIVTTAVEKIQKSLCVIDRYLQQEANVGVAKVLGVHLEGPFLNAEKRGAHPSEYLLPLTLDNVKRVLGEYAHVVKIITLAPEIDASGEAIAYLHALGITISLGHSQATAAQAEQSFSQGACMVTHAFNAMPGLHHREPGLLGAALAHPQVYCGVIADGEHICRTMLQLLLKAGDYEKGLFLVSDALAPIGLPDGVYPWDERHIEVKQGTARLENGTLSGTTLPLLVGAQNLVKWGLCDAQRAIALATESPRKAIGLPTLAVGEPANLIRWHEEANSSQLTWQRLG